MLQSELKKKHFDNKKKKLLEYFNMHTVQNRLSTAVKILRMLKLSFKNNNQANLPEISTCRIQNEAMLTL